MNRLKRTLSLTLSMLLLLSAMCIATTAAYAPQHTEDADILYELGLFKGMGSDANGNPIYGLEQKATRIQGIVLLLHLLGEEADAQAFEGIHPFTDVPDWGSKHVAYAYAKGYTSGTSATTFGSDSPLVGKAYATFVLKALGYDANSDFNYNTALEKATELGLIQAGECDGELYRDHCVMLSRNALKTNMKDSEQKLVEKLLDDGVVTEETIQSSRVLERVVAVPLDSKTGSLRSHDIAAAIPDAYYISAGGMSSNWSYSSIDWTRDDVRNTIFLNLFGQYVTGESEQLAHPGTTFDPKRNTSFPLSSYRSRTVFIQVANKECEMIAYAVLPPYFSGDTVYLTTCKVGGRDELERVKNTTASLPTYTVSDFHYKDMVATIRPDGKSELNAYITIDLSKLPQQVRDEVAYYSGGFFTGKEAYLDSLLDYKQYSTYDGTYTQDFFDATTPRLEPVRYMRYSEERILNLYNADRKLIAVVVAPNSNAVVETVKVEFADPDTFVPTPRTDEQVQQALDSFVTGYKTSAAYDPESFIGKNADTYLGIIKKDPESSKTLMAFIEHYRNGNLSDQAFTYLLECWVDAAGCRKR